MAPRLEGRREIAEHDRQVPRVSRPAYCIPRAGEFPLTHKCDSGASSRVVERSAGTRKQAGNREHALSLGQLLLQLLVSEGEIGRIRGLRVKRGRAYDRPGTVGYALSRPREHRPGASQG